MQSYSNKDAAKEKKGIANQLSNRSSNDALAGWTKQRNNAMVAQRKLQDMANNSPQVRYQQSIQAMADKSISKNPLIPGNFPVSQQPVQRRVALAMDDRDKQDDLVILTNLNYALSYAGGPVVDLGKNADFSGMKPKEDLMILEHGSPGSINKDFDATRIADELTGKEETAIPKNIGQVILLSCYAGTPQEGQGEGSALVNGLASILGSRGYDLPVFGKLGAALTSTEVGERSVDPSKEQTYFPIQFRLLKKYGFDKLTMKLDPKAHAKFIAKFGTDEYVKAKTATEVFKDKGIDTSRMTIEEKAEAMSRITAEFYKELIAEADIAKSLLPEFKDERIALGDVYMDP